MASQVQNGKGFEWAVAFASKLSLGVGISDNEETRYASKCFEGLSAAKQQTFRSCAERAIAYVVEIEGLKHDPSGVANLAKDVAGERGDVRDLVLSTNARTIGISCKTNHEAFKHPRLSGKIDFVKKWGLGTGCSDDYWAVVRPIFSELAKIKKESSSTMKWSALGDYQARYYLPVLAAWKAELLRVAGGDDASSKSAATALCRYIIGEVDFWKVISRHDQVRLYAFNTQNSLRTAKTVLPNRVLGIDSHDGSQYSMTVRMNEGYQFNFRIHNAKATVESSLKFDVQSEGLPSHIHQHDILLSRS